MPFVGSEVKATFEELKSPRRPTLFSLTTVTTRTKTIACWRN